MTLNLNKSAEAMRLSLDKKGVSRSVQAEIAFDLDVSGSYQDEHEDGSTQLLLERLVPVSMVFDPDKQMDVFTFSAGEQNAHHVGVITPDTVDGYIKSKIIGRVPGWCGGTHYSHVIRKNLIKFGWLQETTAPTPAPKKGFFGRFGGGGSVTATATPVAAAAPRKSIVLLNTDGENNDEDETYNLLAESEARKDQIYFIFLAYANGGAQFPFLKKIGDDFGNTATVDIPDLKEFVSLSDEALTELLLGDELINWLKQ